MITLVPGTGLRFSLEAKYQPLRPFPGGGELWDFQYQNVIRNGTLGRILPRADWSPDDGTVTFILTDHGQEVTSRSKPIGDSRFRKRPLVEGLYALESRLRALASDPDTAADHRQAIEQFRLPDPQRDPECYRVYGPIWNRRLLVLWGFARLERTGVLTGLTPQEVIDTIGNGANHSFSQGVITKALLLGTGLLALLLLAFLLCKVAGFPICGETGTDRSAAEPTMAPTQPPADDKKVPDTGSQPQDDDAARVAAAPADPTWDNGWVSVPPSSTRPGPPGPGSDRIRPGTAPTTDPKIAPPAKPIDNNGKNVPSEVPATDAGAKDADTSAPDFAAVPQLDDAFRLEQQPGPKSPDRPDLQAEPNDEFEPGKQANSSKPVHATEPEGSVPSPGVVEPGEPLTKIEPAPGLADIDSASPSTDRDQTTTLGQPSVGTKGSIWVRPRIVARKMMDGNVVQISLKAENNGSRRADLRKTKWVVRGRSVPRFGPNVSFNLPPADKPYTLELYPDGETKPVLYHLDVEVEAFGKATLRRRE